MRAPRPHPVPPWVVATTLAALVALAPPVRSTADEGGGEDVLAPLPWHRDDDTVFLRRIVDRRTGAPVPGATVALLPEDPHPEPGPPHPAAVGHADAAGWVRIDRGDLDPDVTARLGDPTWAYVGAEGYGPDAEMNEFFPDADWEIYPASELRLTLHDPLDRPVVGARVGWFLGCGHTPDVLDVVTDVHGRARLVGLPAQSEGRAWVVKEGFASRYLDAEAWRPWAREKVARLGWGSPAIRGRVLAPDGTPAAGLTVGSAEWQRGPWTHTDADGRFEVAGFPPTPGYTLIVADRWYPVGPNTPAPRALFGVPFAGREATVRLPAQGHEGEDVLTGDRHLEVVVEGPKWTDDQEVSRVVLASSVADGVVAETDPDADGVARFDLPAGLYDIQAIALHAGHVVSRAGARADLSSASEATVDLALPDPAAVRIETPPDKTADEITAVTLVSDGIDEAPLGDEGHPVPDRVLLLPGRAYSLRIEWEGRTRFLPIDPASLVPGRTARPLRLPSETPVAVTARLLDPSGPPTPGWILEYGDDLEPPPVPAETPARGHVLPGARVLLVAWPADARLQPLLLLDRAIASGLDALDLGDVPVPRRGPALTLLDEAGHPLEVEAEVEVIAGSRCETMTPRAGDPPGVYRDDWSAPGLVVEGATVHVSGVGGEGTVVLPYRDVLRGPGPWRVVAPAGSLRVSCADPSGAVGAFQVHLDGRSYDAREGELTLRRLAAGPHEVVVEAEGHVPRRLGFTLQDGEARTWTAHLTPRP